MEEIYGDEENIEMVREKAQEYLKTQQDEKE
jgi:hypothetical protein